MSEEYLEKPCKICKQNLRFKAEENKENHDLIFHPVCYDFYELLLKVLGPASELITQAEKLRVKYGVK